MSTELGDIVITKPSTARASVQVVDNIDSESSSFHMAQSDAWVGVSQFMNISEMGRALDSAYAEIESLSQRLNALAVGVKGVEDRLNDTEPGIEVQAVAKPAPKARSRA